MSPFIIKFCKHIHNVLMLCCFFTFAFCYQSCVPPTDRTPTNLSLGISDPTIKSILNYQDKGSVDSLIPFLTNKNPGVRYAAVKAFASIKDKNTVDQIAKLLKDPVIEIRAMAAFALGQIGNEKSEMALISAFTSRDTLSVNNVFNQNILEALGKCGGKSTLKNIASVVSYRPNDDYLLLGQIRSLYRFGQRNIFEDAATNCAINYIVNENYTPEVRLMAAHYLSRFKDVNIVPMMDKLMAQIETEDNPDVKMALVSAIGRSGNPSIAKRVLNLIDTEKDYRVKCNMVRSLSNYEFDSVKNVVFRCVKDPNTHVGIIAAELIGKKGKKEELYDYKLLANDSTLDWSVRAKLYQSVMKASPMFFTKFKNEVVAEILTKFNKSKNNYERSALIKAIGEDPYQYLTLGGMKDKLTSPVEKSTLVEALGGIMSHPEFLKAYGSRYGEVKSYIINNMIEACKSGDAGMVAAAGTILKNPVLAAKEFVFDSSWFSIAKAKLKLPRDVEAYNEILETNAVFLDSTFVKYKVPFNHPINFNTLETNGDSIKVVMKTSKGNITLLLFSQKAPGSVANFVDLCKNDFYDNKIFHRVVPNFVIQAGCPRGDGYGANDYTIRSELDQSYFNTSGLLGMAHAGNHTEGTQFFITHSPTPHLDGSYTIFGKVLEGMDVVHNIQVGDKIIDAIILK
jgi:cyclophilin family peptidyl-prolyl cis-trans isomerase